MSGRKQPEPFNPERAALLDDPERERWLSTSGIIQMLEARSGMRILDYGTGTGRYAFAIARSHPQTRVTAFDIQQRMLAIVNERIAQSGLENIHTAGPDPSQVPAATFDRVLGVHMLHEIDDEHLEHIARTLKPGGSLLMIDWDGSVPRDFGPPPDHVHTLDEALGRLQRTGYATEVLDSPNFPYHFAIRAFST